MFIIFAHLAFSAVRSCSLAEAKESIRTRDAYILIAESTSMEYMNLINEFVISAHESMHDEDFIIIDASLEKVDLSEFNISRKTLPVVIYIADGMKYAVANGPYVSASLVQFYNTYSIDPIPYLNTKDDFEHFIQTSALGLIAAFDVIPENVKNIFVEFNKLHYNEICVAFSKANLVEKPGFYMYRYTDDSLEFLGELPDCTEEDLINLMVPKTVPSLVKMDSITSNVLENDLQMFSIVDIEMEHFYLSSQQASDLKAISKGCGFNVTYSSTRYGELSQFRYGFPKPKGTRMAVIDARNAKRIHKYLLNEEEFSVENGISLCKKIHDGSAIEFFKSTNYPDDKSKTYKEVNSYTAIDFIAKNKHAAIGIYFADDACLVPLQDASKKLEKNKSGIQVAQFSTAENDWQGVDADFDLLPRLLLFQDGKLLANLKSGNTTDAVLDQIAETYSSQKEL